jgi:outer membrane protein
MNRKNLLRLGLSHASLACMLSLPMSAVLADENDGWDVTLGAGVATLPKYPGSDDTETHALPLISVRYGRFFIGGVPGAGTPAGLGAYLHESERWSVGVAVSGDVIKPREESDDPRLRGLGDIDSTVRGGVFASYTLDWFTLRGSVLSDLGGNDQGTLVSLDAEARYSPSDRLTLSAGPGLTWANADYTQTFFGVSAEQAANSGFGEYSPKSGVALVRLSFGANYRLTPHWNLGARVSAAQLNGDAGDSAIVEDKNQNTYALFVSYRF